ncbi:MAG: hypothetical protein AMXMBFR16_10700 [Candidatus Uhrbacteria bacterium]
MSKRRIAPPELVEKYTAKGEFVIPTKIKAGTTLLVETHEQIYEVNARENGLFVTSYGKMFTGRDRKCYIDGCIHGQSGILFADLILEGMHLAMVIQGVGSYTTGRVLSVCLRGKGWHFEPWTKKTL